MDSTKQIPASKTKPELRVLIVEDSKIEAGFLVNLLNKNGYSVVHERVETEEQMASALDNRKWDIVVSDFQMPDFNGERALTVFLEREVDIPFILVSGKIGEETAVDLMKLGAHDYIMKGNTARLVPAIESQLKDAANRREKRRLEKKLLESEARYRGFFQNAHIGIFRCSENGAILDANSELAAAFGYASVAEFVKTVGRLRPEVLEESRREAAAADLQALAERDSQFEVQFHRQDGSILAAKMRAWIIQEDKGTLAVIEGVIEDITEQKEIERKLREMQQLHDSLINLTCNL